MHKTKEEKILNKEIKCILPGRRLNGCSPSCQKPFRPITVQDPLHPSCNSRASAQSVEFLSLRHFGDRIISTIFVCIPDTAVCIPYCIKDRFFTPAVEITNAKMSLREKIFHPNTLTLVTKNAIDCRR